MGRIFVEKELLPVMICKTEITDNNGTYKYKYKCVCGKEFLTYKRSVETQRCKSCGCLRNKYISEANKGFIPRNRKSPEDMSIAYIYYSSKYAAKSKRFEFELTRKDVGDLIFKPCYYCGDLPSRFPRRTKDSSPLTIPINGIDRFNNLIGYIKENCVTCCSDCNYLKSSRSGDAFISKILSIANYLNSNGEL